MAVNVATYFRFDAPIDRASLEVEGRTTLFRVVDVGDRTLMLELAVEPSAAEKLGVRVRYKDGASPAYATFALVSHPTLVDKEVKVVRRLRTSEVPEAEPARCEANGPAGLVLSGLLDKYGVQVTEFHATVPPGNRSGLVPGRGLGYRARRWVVVAVFLKNLSGQKPWAPGSASLFSSEGRAGRVRLVQLQGTSQLQPGESGFVVVEVEAPVPSKGPFRLDLLDAEGGRLLPIHDVVF